MSSTQYSLASSYQLMENHIPAAVLDDAHGFRAYLTPANATVLLSIGTDAIFRASVESQGTVTGWVVTDISQLLAGKYPAGSTISSHSFDASGHVVANGGFSILLAVTVATVGKSPADEVWLLTGPPGADASSWLVGGASITWRKLEYDAVSSPPIQAITAAGLRVTSLHLESGLQQNDPTIALATVQDPGATSELRCFLLNLSGGTNPVWSYYPQEQNIGTANLGIAPGRVKSDPSWGLYKLYSLNGVASLTYLPTKGAFGPPDATLFTVPSGASAIASLVYQPSGPVSYTDLFVAANGFISYFSYDQGPPHEGIKIITSSLVTGVTQLHAVNCGGKVVVWGLNAAKQVFYTTASLEQRADPSAWQPPIALLSSATSIAALAGTAADAISLFAMAPLSSTTATGNAGSGLLQLSRNASTKAWRNSVHPLPSTLDCITLKSYTTRALLLNSFGVPQPSVPVTVSVSADCSLIINGVSTPVSTSDTLRLTTDNGGYINLIHAVSSLATPAFTVTLPGGLSQTIDPTGAVRTSLQGITTPEDLTSATYVDARGNTQKLVAPGTSTDAIAGVVKAIQAISPKLSSLPRAAGHNASLQTKATTPVLVDGSLFSDLGDLVQWVGNVVEDVGGVVFESIDGVIHLVVTIAGDVFRAIVNTVEDALHAITAVFKWIGAEIEMIFRWLAFLFDWLEFIAVKNTLKSVVTQSLTSFESIQDKIQTAGDAWFDHAKANILPHLATTPMAKPSNKPMQAAWSSAVASPSPVGSGNTDLRTDPKLGWLKDRVNTPATASATAVTGIATNGTDPIGQLQKDIEGLVSDVGQTFKTLFGDLGQLISGEISAADFFDSFLAAIELLGIDALRTVFDSLMLAFRTLSSSVLATLNASIDIPILSALYSLISGSDLTILDLMCLISAIGLSVVYKIVTGDSPASFLKENATPAAIHNVITNTIATAIQPPPPVGGTPAPAAHATATTTNAATTAAVAMNADASSPWQTLSGCLLILQSITQSVDGGAMIGQQPQLANMAYSMDLNIRNLQLITEVIANGWPTSIGGTQVIFEAVWTTLLSTSVYWQLHIGGLGSELVHTTWYADANMSLVWVIWHLINISQDGNCPADLSAKAAEGFFTVLQAGATPASPEAAVVMLVCRDISTITDAVTRF